jgi:hypothetical protein
MNTNKETSLSSSKESTTGYVFEKLVSEKLIQNGYSVVPKKQRNKLMPLQRNGRKHRIDVRLDNGILVSCKSNDKVWGTAEEKIPFECLKLQHAIEDSNGLFHQAYIILGGNKWHNKEYYLSEDFKNQIHMPNVRIIRFEDIDDHFTPKEIL